MTTTSTGHPRGLYVLFFTEMWERFGFYTMSPIFLLDLEATAEDGGLVLVSVLLVVVRGVLNRAAE